LYEGEKTLMWDAVNGTALAKHETYHANMYSTAVYIALPLVTNVPEQFVGTSLVVWYVIDVDCIAHPYTGP
jgi:isoleucyl-tRNA synthetase